MSSMGMPLTTLEPTKGGTNTGLSVSTSGERSVRRPRRAVVAAPELVVRRDATLDSLGTRPQSGSSASPVPRLQLAQAVHHPQPLEGVLAVEQPALVHLAQVALDVGAGQGRAAQQHRDVVGQAAAVELLEVVAHDERALDQQPAHADGVGLDLGRLLDHLGDADLDAEVVHLVAVVGQDDVDQVLADVVHVALDRGQHDAALAARLVLLHVGLEVGHRRLHGLGRLQHEGQLHLAGGEQLAHHLHAGQQDVVDDGQRGDARRPWPGRGRPRGPRGRRR